METVKRTIEQEALLFLEDGIQELRTDIQRARNLLMDGKVIQCNQRLQGSLTKCDNALTYIREVGKESGCVVEATDSEKPKEQPDS